ncbi:MAG: transporter substrate-binding domain-containing protein [Caldilineaceae bacterium]
MTFKRSTFLPVLVLLLGLLISACVAPAPAETPASGDAAPAESAAPSAAASSDTVADKGLTNFVYRDLPDLGGRSVAVVTSNSYLPLNFVDPASGEPGGWEYDAVQEICRRLNCTVEWGVSSWEAMIPAVAQGQYDIGMDGITINAERDEQIDFSDPYMTSRQFMLVRADEDRFTTPEEFAADESLLVGADRHHRLLHRHLRHPRRRRSQPAHHYYRRLRRHRAVELSVTTLTRNPQLATRNGETHDLQTFNLPPRARAAVGAFDQRLRGPGSGRDTRIR